MFYLFIVLFIYLFIRSYLQTWGDHSMRSIVLTWYPGGRHVLLKMQGRHLYLHDWHGEGSQKKKNIKQKTRRLQAYQRMRQENRHRRRFISGDFIILSTFRLSLKCLYIPGLILFLRAHNWQKIRNHFKIDFWHNKYRPACVPQEN